MELVGLMPLILILLCCFWLFGDEFIDMVQRLRGTQPLEIDWNIAMSEHVNGLLPDDRLGAIRNYSEMADVSADEAKRVVDYLTVVANDYRVKSGPKAPATDDAEGIRHLVEAGEYERAAEIYATYHNVDLYTAQQAVDRLKRPDHRLREIYESADAVAQAEYESEVRSMNVRR